MGEVKREADPPPVEWNAYPDAGLIFPNPSPHGGTWAVVYVDVRTGETVEIYGSVTTAELGMPFVENNLMETLAVLQALKCVPPGVRLLTVFCDNLNAIRRAQAPAAAKFGGCPEWVGAKLAVERTRQFPIFTLIGGHPTRAELARGFRVNDDGSPGTPVSKWNVRADQLCREEAVRLAARLGVTTTKDTAPSPAGRTRPNRTSG